MSAFDSFLSNSIDDSGILSEELSSPNVGPDITDTSSPLFGTQDTSGYNSTNSVNQLPAGLGTNYQYSGAAGPPGTQVPITGTAATGSPSNTPNTQTGLAGILGGFANLLGGAAGVATQYAANQQKAAALSLQSQQLSQLLFYGGIALVAILLIERSK